MLTCTPLPSLYLPSNGNSNTVSFSAFVSATDNAPGVKVACTPPSNSTFFKGDNVVNCIAEDASGNLDHCAFFVTLRDGTLPVVSCQANVQLPTDPGKNFATYSYPLPSATDNDAVSPIGALCSFPQPFQYPHAIPSSVLCNVSDVSGNVNFCQFSVVVVDLEPPVVVCPIPPATLYVLQMGGIANLSYTLAPVTDNVAVQSVYLSQNNVEIIGFPSSLGVGDYLFKYSATDKAGNLSPQCSFFQSVQKSGDNEAPKVMNCPASLVTIQTSPGISTGTSLYYDVTNPATMTSLTFLLWRH